MIHVSGSVRRLLVLGSAAAALVAVASGSVALASNNGTKPSSSVAAATTTPVVSQSNPFDAAIQALVEDGTINQTQADVLRPQIDAGGVDLQEFVDSGVLTAPQLQAVQARLRAVKQSLAAGAASQVPTPEKAQPAGSSATESDDVKRAEKEAAAASQAATPGTAQPTGSPATK